MRRLFRNARAILFITIMPAILFVLFGRGETAGDDNLTGFVLIGVAVYGAMLATTNGGAMVASERAVGWNRQLRLTPLRPVAYIAVKVAVAMALGAITISVTFGVGALAGARLGGATWAWSAGLAWAGAVVFAAFGVLMGYLMPREHVMYMLGPLLAVLGYAGGLFTPVDRMGDVLAAIAPLSPAYGLGVLARHPLTGEGPLVGGTLSVVGWTAAFTLAAVVVYRRDADRM
ncbi:MAG TPA: ABC transporter permease [Pilimelia sp.]|nr:ABC transporter permease [Pilimelia sp.]